MNEHELTELILNPKSAVLISVTQPFNAIALNGENLDKIIRSYLEEKAKEIDNELRGDELACEVTPKLIREILGLSEQKKEEVKWCEHIKHGETKTNYGSFKFNCFVMNFNEWHKSFYDR